VSDARYDESFGVMRERLHAIATQTQKQKTAAFQPPI
jgi:hypothetical protein